MEDRFAIAYNKKIIDIITSIQSQSITCASAVSQYASLYAIKNYKNIITNIYNLMKSKRDFFVEIWNKTFDKKILLPDAALYSFINIKNINLNIKAYEFAINLLKDNNVAVMPGTPFGNDDYFRISFCSDKKDIEESIDKINNYVKMYNNKYNNK